MKTFGEGGMQEHGFDYDILNNAEEIKQRIIQMIRTGEYDECGYDWKSIRILKGDYGKPDKRAWVRIFPNFDTKSAKLIVVNNDSWELSTYETNFIEIVKDLLRKWGIEEYCICNEADQFLEYFQPLEKGV